MKTLEDHPAAVAVRVDDAVPDVVDVAGRVLGGLNAVIAPWFAQAGTRLAAQQYVRGLASTVERKNSWQLAEHAGHRTPDRLQRLLSTSAWDEAGVREDVRDWAVRSLADGQAVLVADDTGFLKKGRSSAGVQRQYSGTAGRIENCQIGVFLTYATGQGRLLIDAELYLPVSWTDDPHRCAKAGVPAEVGFATKPELAQVMIERVVREKLPFGWVAADEAYGDNPGLRHWLEGRGIRYVMAVSRDHTVATAQGPVRADVLATAPELVWQRLSCGDGAKGPRLYDFAQVPDAAGPDHRLVVRRAIDDGELAFFWCHTPGGAGLPELVRVIGLRWAVEECLCATRRSVVFPVQLGGTRREVPGSDGLPDAEKLFGDKSMPGNRWSCPGVWGGASGDPRDMAKAGLLEAQSPVDATSHPPERRLKPVPCPATAMKHSHRNLRIAERRPARAFKEMSGPPTSRYDV